MTVHTWANKEERGTLRIRLKCSHNRRSKCKFSFQLCYGLTECFWYLRRGSGNHVHCGHELDKPRTRNKGDQSYTTATRIPEPSHPKKGKKPAGVGTASIVEKRKVSPLLDLAVMTSSPTTALVGASRSAVQKPTKQPKLDSFLGGAYCLPANSHSASMSQISSMSQLLSSGQGFLDPTKKESNGGLATTTTGPAVDTMNTAQQQQQRPPPQQQAPLLGIKTPTPDEQEAAESLIASARPTVSKTKPVRRESSSARRSKFIAAVLDQQSSSYLDDGIGLQTTGTASSSLQQPPSQFQSGVTNGGCPVSSLHGIRDQHSNRQIQGNSSSVVGNSPLDEEKPTLSSLSQEASRIVYGGLRELPQDSVPTSSFQAKKSQFSSSSSFMMSTTSIGDVYTSTTSLGPMPGQHRPPDRKPENSKLEVVQDLSQEQKHESISSGLTGLPSYNHATRQQPASAADVGADERPIGGTTGLLSDVTSRSKRATPPTSILAYASALRQAETAVGVGADERQLGGSSGPLSDHTSGSEPATRPTSILAYASALRQTETAARVGADERRFGGTSGHLTNRSEAVPRPTSILAYASALRQQEEDLQPTVPAGLLQDHTQRINSGGRITEHPAQNQAAGPESKFVGDRSSGVLSDHTRRNTGSRLLGNACNGVSGLADHTSAPKRATTEAARGVTTRDVRRPVASGGDGILPDHTTAPAANPAIQKPKLTRGASFFSSIDTFQFSSAGSLGDSEDDIGKLEGFGGGTPAKQSGAGGVKGATKKSEGQAVYL